VLPYDDSIIGGMDADALTEYLEDSSKYGVYAWKEKLSPNAAWPIPLVTGRTYKIHW